MNRTVPCLPLVNNRYTTISYSHWLCYAAAFSTVHPLGMPLRPVDHPVILVALTKVPVDATLFSQLEVQRDADMFVARHLI